jgi:hypothetical protein
MREVVEWISWYICVCDIVSFLKSKCMLALISLIINTVAVLGLHTYCIVLLFTTKRINLILNHHAFHLLLCNDFSQNKNVMVFFNSVWKSVIYLKYFQGYSFSSVFNLAMEIQNIFLIDIPFTFVEIQIYLDAFNKSAYKQTV